MTAVMMQRRGTLEEVVDRGHLKRRIEPAGFLRAYGPSGFDRSLLAVADRAVSLPKPVALVLPIAGTNTAILLAATILVAHFVRSRTLTANVAVVTKQLRLRRVYDTLFCRDQHLADFFPRTVVSANGITEVGSRSLDLMGNPGRLHFVGDLRLVPTIPRALDGVVVESQAADEGVLRRLLQARGNSAPLIYLTMNPRDPLLDEFARVGAVWAWDQETLKSLDDGKSGADAICAATAVLRGASVTSYDIASPEGDGEVDATLARLWDDLSVLQRHGNRGGYETTAWAWGIFNSISQLAVPVAMYDKHARAAWGTTSLGEAAGKAEAFARHAANPDERELWEVLALDLEDAVVSAQRASVKPDAAVAWVRNSLVAKNPALAVVRNRAARNAFEEMLETRPDVPMGWRESVRIATFSELLGGRVEQAEAMLYAGPITSRYGGLLALPVAERLTILAHGPWEARRIERQIRAETERLGDLAQGSIHHDAIEVLFDGVDPGPSCDPKPVTISGSRVAAPRAVPAAAREAVWDPFEVSILKRLTRDDLDGEGPARDAPDGPKGVVEVLRIEFDDAVGLFEPGCLVSRVEGDALVEVAAKGLKPDDLVVLVEGGARRDLFDLIVDRLEGLPELQAMLMLVTEWHERARGAVFASRLTYEQILDRMEGTTISTVQTIRNWVLGLVHGPADPHDIRRFGIAVGDEFLSARWEPVGRALATMRAHRRKIGRMLARVISGITPAELEDDGYFDRRLGIHYSDFADAVSDHRVVHVGGVATVPYAFSNRLVDDDIGVLVLGGS